jgi:hypothetical protein
MWTRSTCSLSNEEDDMLGDNGNTLTQNSNTVATTIEITASKTKNTANILNISSSSKYVIINIIKNIYFQITASKNI